MSAAKAILAEPSLGLRAAAEKRGVRHASHVHYWLKKLRGTEMEEAAQVVASRDEAASSASLTIHSSTSSASPDDCEQI